MKKLIIIPAFNEEESIYKTVNDIIQNAPEFDYIVVNDCSTDKTAQICKNNKFNYINLPINLGIGGAVQTGYRYAYENGYDMAVQVDGDGQHDAVFLSKMAETMKKEKGDKEHERDQSIRRKCGSKRGDESRNRGSEI